MEPGLCLVELTCSVETEEKEVSHDWTEPWLSVGLSQM